MPQASDSYSTAERRLLEPAHRALLVLFAPTVWLLRRLRVTPNTVSLSQVLLALVIVVLIPTHPRVALVLFVVAVALDGVDGALARATHRSTRFGALLDQYADHAREVIVVAGMAAHGGLDAFVAVLYGVVYPAFNLTLYLCNAQRVPVPFAIKSYLTFYPALFAYLWLGVDVLDEAATLTVALMTAVVVWGMWRLRGVMDAPP